MTAPLKRRGSSEPETRRSTGCAIRPARRVTNEARNSLRKRAPIVHLKFNEKQKLLLQKQFWMRQRRQEQHPMRQELLQLVGP